MKNESHESDSSLKLDHDVDKSVWPLPGGRGLGRPLNHTRADLQGGTR